MALALPRGGGGGGLFVNGGLANLTHVTIAQNQLGHSSMQGTGMVALNNATVNIDYSIIANHTSAVALHAQPGSTVNFDTNLLNNRQQIPEAVAVLSAAAATSLEVLLFSRPGRPITITTLTVGPRRLMKQAAVERR